MSVGNGLSLIKIRNPDMKLSEIENSLIAQNIIFQKIFLLPKSRMSAVKDRIINVPMSEVDISKTVSSLPRPLDAAGLLPVKFKRKLDMKNCHLEEYVKPSNCINAVKKLKEIGNPFYQGIKIDEDFHQPSMYVNNQGFCYLTGIIS